MKTSCEGCGIGYRPGGGTVGHEGSGKRVYLCPSCFRDPAVRRRVVEGTFGGLVEGRRAVFKRRSKAEAAEMERRERMGARYGTPTAMLGGTK